MKKTLLSLLLLLLLAAFESPGQPLTLEQCINLALQNNHDFKNSILDVQASDYRIKEIKSALLPTINLAAQSQYYYDLTAQYAPASSFGGAEGEYQKLTLGMEQNTSANIQVSQNVYNQGVVVGLKAAKAARELNTHQLQLTKENLVYNVTTTFYSIQILKENMESIEENIRNLKKTVDINGTMKDHGIVSENSYSRILINLENLHNQYENQKLLVEKNYNLLKQLLDIDMSTTITIAPFNYSDLLIDSVEYALTTRTDIQLQETSVKLAQLEKKSILAGYYPTLINTTSFGYSGFNDSFRPFEAVNNDWIKTSYVALTLRIPVFDGFQKHNQIKQKDIQIQKSLNSLSRLRRTAEREVSDAATNYEANKRLLANNKTSLELADGLFKTATSEFENGITSLTELLNAQSDLTDARTNYSSALLNLKLAELSLQKANGTLLSQSKLNP